MPKSATAKPRKSSGVKAKPKVKSEPAPKPEELIRRSPMDIGPFMCDCHYKVSMDLALAGVIHNSLAAPILEELFEDFDFAMNTFLMVTPNANREGFQQQGLAWLLKNSETLYNEAVRYCKEYHDGPITDNEVRDWHCWLYRHFRDLKHDRQAQEKTNENEESD